jgi:hypothetical protein
MPENRLQCTSFISHLDIHAYEGQRLHNVLKGGTRCSLQREQPGVSTSPDVEHVGSLGLAHAVNGRDVLIFALQLFMRVLNGYENAHC